MSELTVLDHRMNVYRSRVELGAQRLDAEQPGWYKDIDLGKLEMSSSCKCIVGQLGETRIELFDYHCFSENTEILLNLAHDESPDDYGFDFDYNIQHDIDHQVYQTAGYFDDLSQIERDLSYVALEHLWVEQIKDRYERGEG
jgi:hypothetical protein